MAILENGLESIELGATAWREILNYNFAKLLTKEQILALIQQGGANADGSVPSYLTKQEANSIYALKTELGNADLSQYLTLEQAQGKYLSKLEANSFLTQQSADNYYAKKTELSGFATKDELSQINTGSSGVDEKINELKTQIQQNYAKKGEVVIQNADGAINLSAYVLRSEIEKIKNEIKSESKGGKDWVPMTTEDLTPFVEGNSATLKDGYITFSSEIENEQAMLFPESVKKIRVYYDSPSVNISAKVIIHATGEGGMIRLSANFSNPGYLQPIIPIDSDSFYHAPFEGSTSVFSGCAYMVEIIADAVYFTNEATGQRVGFRTENPPRLGVSAYTRTDGSRDATAGNMRIWKWV